VVSLITQQGDGTPTADEFVIYNGCRMIKGWPERIEAAQRISAYLIAGRPVPRVRYGDEKENWGANRHACGDCGVIKGQVHVAGCDIEQCGLCGRQAITCDCPYDEDEG
jgi:hypothetical protein